jgi:membrane-associated protease RseP (regulator of RpoE activity)
MKMLHTVALVLGGLVAGFVVSFWLQPTPVAPRAESPDPARPVGSAAVAAMDSAAAARLAAVEAALDAEILERAALEERVAELAAQLEALGELPRMTAARAAGGVPPADAEALRANARRMVQERDAAGERRAIERLTAAGFPPDRAEWITRREEQLRMAALQAQYDATREGRALAPGEALDAGSTLRTELGDADYERYLTATGRPTSVGVRDVLASSPAEASGLVPGDEIVAYDGTRVFDMRELNALTLAGTAGESVVVDVRRDGQTVRLVMPRGPLGITGGGFRGR